MFKTFKVKSEILWKT